MNISDNILLPGGKHQVEFLLKNTSPSRKNALIIGPDCETVAAQFLSFFDKVEIIVADHDSLIKSRMIIDNEERIKCKIMDFAFTDFDPETFDLIYAQSVTSVPERKKIAKEVKRILNSNGFFCVGEIVSLKEPVPAFVKDIWGRSGLEPLASSEIKKYYEIKGFTVFFEEDLSYSMKDFYQQLNTIISKSNEKEKEQNRNLYTGLKHESDAYLKLGGEKYIGFKSLIMKKKDE